MVKIMSKCLCGCGKEAKEGNRYILGHCLKLLEYNFFLKHKKILSPPQLCLCGCGETTKSGRRYIHGHNGGMGRRKAEKIRRECKKCHTFFVGYNHSLFCPICSNSTKLCKCGCGKSAKPGRDFINGHQGTMKKGYKYNKPSPNYIPREIRECACGCKQTFECKRNSCRK